MVIISCTRDDKIGLETIFISTVFLQYLHDIRDIRIRVRPRFVHWDAHIRICDMLKSALILNFYKY
jgi:hypothetical protein